MDADFSAAAVRGNLERIRDILEASRDLNVNIPVEDIFGGTTLYWAALQGSADLVSFLLAYPDIDVNQKTRSGQTPFSIACRNERTSCVRLLLADPRVLVNDGNVQGTSPLYWAAYSGHIEVVRLYIASGRPMDLGNPGNYARNVVGGMGTLSWPLFWRSSMISLMIRDML